MLEAQSARAASHLLQPVSSRSALSSVTYHRRYWDAVRCNTSQPCMIHNYQDYCNERGRSTHTSLHGNHLKVVSRFAAVAMDGAVLLPVARLRHRAEHV